jgi:hypothetical protein
LKQFDVPTVSRIETRNRPPNIEYPTTISLDEASPKLGAMKPKASILEEEDEIEVTPIADQINKIQSHINRSVT